MGQILHGSAKTTHAVRAAIQRSKASIQELASRYDLNPKTVMKRRKRTFLYDAPMGPKSRSTVLSAEEEALALAFRKACAVAARRLPLCPPSDHPASDAIVGASTVPAPRDQQASCDRRRDRAQEGLHAVSDRLLPHRMGFFTKLTRTAWGVPVGILVVLVKDLAGSLEVGLGGLGHQ